MLNNLEVSSEHILKLKKEIENDCTATFGKIEAKIQSCCDDLGEVSKNFKNILQVIFFFQEPKITLFSARRLDC